MARVEFDPETHIYLIDGIRFPSVTEVIEATVPKSWETAAWWGYRLARQGKRPDDKRNAAANLGTKVHLALAEYAAGNVPDPFDYPDEAAGFIAGLDKFIKDNDPLWVHSEIWTFSLHHGYAGTLDGLVKFRKGKYADQSSRFDLKTGRVYPESHFPQVMAYEEAEIERGHVASDTQLILKVTPGGSYKLIEVTDTFDDFLVLLNHYKSAQARKERGK